MKHAMVNMVPLAMAAFSLTSGAWMAVAQSSVPAFSSATEASKRLFEAVQSNNEQAIMNILGAPTELTSSPEPGEDKADRELFVEKYQEMHRLGREPDGAVTLYIGAENWPFPIPLVRDGDAWHFDADAGQKEVLFRRIGENELTAISTCQDFVASEKHYHADSNPADPTSSSPASMVAKAFSGTDSSDPVLLHGYYFRLLPVGSAIAKKPGQFALIAYPADYRSTGVMTFVVTRVGVVYEKDLGADTPAMASSMKIFHKDATWHPAGD